LATRVCFRWPTLGYNGEARARVTVYLQAGSSGADRWELLSVSASQPR